MDRYEPEQIEPKWQRVWKEARALNVPNPAPGEPLDDRRWYQLEMLPYPSANSLHMGHVFNYTMETSSRTFTAITLAHSPSSSRWPLSWRASSRMVPPPPRRWRLVCPSVPGSSSSFSSQLT